MSAALVLLHTVSRLGRVTEAYFREATAPFGVDQSEAAVLTMLMNAPDRTLSPTRLGEALVQTSPGMAATLNRLDQKGLIDRHRDLNDGRRRLVHLAPQGQVLVEDLLTTLLAAFEELFGSSEEGCDALAAGLQTVLNGLELAGGHRSSAALAPALRGMASNRCVPQEKPA